MRLGRDRSTWALAVVYVVACTRRAPEQQQQQQQHRTTSELFKILPDSVCGLLPRARALGTHLLGQGTGRTVRARAKGGRRWLSGGWRRSYRWLGTMATTTTTHRESSFCQLREKGSEREGHNVTNPATHRMWASCGGRRVDTLFVAGRAQSEARQRPGGKSQKWCSVEK